MAIFSAFLPSAPALRPRPRRVGAAYGADPAAAEREAKALILRSIEIEAERGLPRPFEAWTAGLDGDAKRLGDQVVTWVVANIVAPFADATGARRTFEGFSGAFQRSLCQGEATVNVATNAPQLKALFDAQDRQDRARGVLPLSSTRVLAAFQQVVA